MGKVLKIYLRASSGEPAMEVECAEAVVGTGLDGDHATGPKRQVTVLSRDAWEAASAVLGKEIDPAIRRANLLVEGVELSETKERTLRIGPVELKLTGETKPCRLMEESVTGLKAALAPDWRGGAFGEVVTGGTISVGDEVTFVN
jgi:MOSC domain-containing protein YiiM